jgi:hypothetical protein
MCCAGSAFLSHWKSIGSERLKCEEAIVVILCICHDLASCSYFFGERGKFIMFIWMDGGCI